MSDRARSHGARPPAPDPASRWASEGLGGGDPRSRKFSFQPGAFQPGLFEAAQVRLDPHRPRLTRAARRGTRSRGRAPRGPHRNRCGSGVSSSSSPRLRRSASSALRFVGREHDGPALSHGGVEKLGVHRHRRLQWPAVPAPGPAWAPRPRAHQLRLTTSRARCCDGSKAKSPSGCRSTPSALFRPPAPSSLPRRSRHPLSGVATSMRLAPQRTAGPEVPTWAEDPTRTPDSSGIGKWRPRGVVAILQAPLSGKRRVSQPFWLRTRGAGRAESHGLTARQIEGRHRSPRSRRQGAREWAHAECPHPGGGRCACPAGRSDRLRARPGHPRWPVDRAGDPGRLGGPADRRVPSA